jgi:hypothetical protein
LMFEVVEELFSMKNRLFHLDIIECELAFLKNNKRILGL